MRSNYRSVSCPCSHPGSVPGLDRLCRPTPKLLPRGDTLRCKRSFGGSGISTGCPSPTTFVLGLGPTNPERTSLPQETLGLSLIHISEPTRLLSISYAVF